MENCKEEVHEKIKEKLAKGGELNESVEKVGNIFSLIGEPNRLKIILALKEGELCVYHITEITGGKQSATSQHLRKLKDGNIIKCRKEGNQVLYSLCDKHVFSLIENALNHVKC